MLEVCPLRRRALRPALLWQPRHCSTLSCQKLNGAQWLEQQTELLLPIPYFHVVFTLPHELNLLIRHNQASLYAILFASATATLLEFGPGITSRRPWELPPILHTWGQNLTDHYHLHCVVTGGGLALDGKSWVSAPRQWLFAVRALSVVFSAKFRDGLQQLFDDGQLRVIPKVGTASIRPGCLCARAASSLPPQMGRLHQTALCRSASRPGVFMSLHSSCRHQQQPTGGFELSKRNGRNPFRYKDYASKASSGR